MTQARVNYTGDGKVKTFAIPFPYLSSDHVEVRVNGVKITDLSFPTNGQVTLPTSPSNGSKVQIIRNTPGERLVDFVDLGMLNEKILDLDSNQLLYLTQEAMSLAQESLNMDFDGNYNLEGKRIKNVGDPTEPKDAVTKEYVDGELDATMVHIEGLTILAEAHADRAQTARDEIDLLLEGVQEGTIRRLTSMIVQEGDMWDE